MTRRRLGTIAVALLVTLVVSATAVWLALPSLARRAVVWQVEAQTGRKLTMREFDLDLRDGHLRITGLRLDDREPGPPLAQLDRLEVRFRPGTLLRGHLWIEDLALDNPRVRIVRTGRGVLNISDLLRPSRPREQAAALTLDRFALTGGAITFEDRTLTPPRTWRADALTIEAALLSTVNPEPRGHGRLTATVAGAPLSVEMSEVRLAPMHGRVRVNLSNMDATLANL
ncbi:MAG: AsmA family protein, partial [Candidatus Rokuibacteriota bacterium]